MKKSFTDFILDTNGHCFICLNRAPSQFLDDSSSANQTKSLLYLSRYLKMDMGKVFNDNQSISSDLIAQVRKSRLRSSLCEKCTKLNEKISKRCRQLEKIEMEMSSYLNQVQEKLLVAKKTGEEIMQDDLNGRLQIMEALRTEATMKCSLKLKPVEPTARIRKLTGSQIDSKRSNLKRRKPTSQPEKSTPESDSNVKVEAPFLDVGSENDSNNDLPSDDMEVVDDDLNQNVSGGEIRERHRWIRGSSLINENEAQLLPAAPNASSSNNPGKSTINPETGKHKCDTCSKEFGNIGSFRAHYKNVHIGVRYKCNLCGKNFHASSHKRHYETVHMGVKFAKTIQKRSTVSLSETDYGKVVTSSSDLGSEDGRDNVVNDPHPDNPEEDFSMEFDDDDDLIETDPPSYDNGAFDGGCPTAPSNAIEFNVDGKSSINPATGKHKCSTCSKEFGNFNIFKSHYKNVHIGVRYKCNLCGKNFHANSHKRHYETVHMGARFKCGICNKEFTYKFSLKKHQQTSCTSSN